MHAYTYTKHTRIHIIQRESERERERERERESERERARTRSLSLKEQRENLLLELVKILPVSLLRLYTVGGRMHHVKSARRSYDAHDAEQPAWD